MSWPPATPPLPASSTPVCLALSQEGGIWAPLPLGGRKGSQSIPGSTRSVFWHQTACPGAAKPGFSWQGPTGQTRGGIVPPLRTGRAGTSLLGSALTDMKPQFLNLGCPPRAPQVGVSVPAVILVLGSERAGNHGGSPSCAHCGPGTPMMPSGLTAVPWRNSWDPHMDTQV